MVKRSFTKFVTTASICLGVAFTAVAAEDDLGIWTIVSTSDAFQLDSGPSRWLYTFDAQARYFDVGSGANQYLLRPGGEDRVNHLATLHFKVDF